jgi:hypothetical protein
MSERESRCRLIKEHFLTPEQCQILRNLMVKHSVVGDGYKGNPHPHLPTETFAGIGLVPATRLFDQAERQLVLHMLLQARRLIMDRFRLPMLWLDLGHFAIRRQGNAQNDSEEEYSHTWHYDNFFRVHRHRTHSAVLYFNDDFEGGRMLFKETAFGPSRVIRPKAGTMIAFSVAENEHAVSRLIYGKRLALNMGFSTSWKRYFQHMRTVRRLGLTSLKDWVQWLPNS